MTNPKPMPKSKNRSADPPSTEEDELDTLNEGRSPVKVTFRDGSTDSVTVRKCGLAQMPLLQKAQGDPVQKLLLYLDGERRDPAWVDTLTPESQLDLLDRGGELNDPLFERYLRGMLASQKAWGLDMEGLMKTLESRLSAEFSLSSPGAESIPTGRSSGPGTSSSSSTGAPAKKPRKGRRGSS